MKSIDDANEEMRKDMELKIKKLLSLGSVSRKVVENVTCPVTN